MKADESAKRLCTEHPEDHPVAPMDGKPGYCFGCVKEDARQRCVEKGEGWRWGVSA